MIRGALMAAGCALGSAALADMPDMACGGEAPFWTLRASGAEASFGWPAQLHYDIPQMTRAEGRAWPLAATLIERDQRATAILLVDAALCESGGQRAHVLTQRGTEPVLLTGCCALQPDAEPAGAD